MSRYVDADALHDTLKAKQKWVVRCGDKHNEGYTYDQVHFAIDDAPSIDIVRCGECKYYIDNSCDCYSLYGDLSGDLIGVSFEPNEDFFCSYGERREP